MLILLRKFIDIVQKQKKLTLILFNAVKSLQESLTVNFYKEEKRENIL